MNDYSIKHCDDENNIGCTETCYKDINVSIPVTIKPFGKIGNVKTKCLEGSIICKNNSHHCPDTEDSCKYVITQKICVEIPVVFGASVEAEEAFIDCDCQKKQPDCFDGINESDIS